VLRTDNGGEFTTAEFATYCAGEGITRHFSVPYTPQQNGVVEQRNQTVVAMARALLKQRRMPAKFWGEAVVTAVYLQNWLLTKSLVGRTPYEAWQRRIASSIRWLGRCARRVTSCLMRRMAGTGPQPRARHRRQFSPSNTSTPRHQERQ
jgi:transposase InsO family protein